MKPLWDHPHIGRAALVVTAGVAAATFFRLTGFAATAILFTDECWHALVALAIVGAKGLVTTTTAVLAEPLPLDYPPLFHLLTAVGYVVVGLPVFFYLNLVVAAGLLVLVLIGPGRLLDPVQKGSVALALLATPLFVMYNLRLYTEMLTTLVFFGSWWWFAKALRDGRKQDAFWSGIFTGLLVWTKQTGLVVLGFYGLVLLWTVVRKQRARSQVLAWIVGPAAVIAAGYLGPTFARGEHPLLFAYPTQHAELWSAHMIYVPLSIFWDTLKATYGTITLVMLGLPVAILLARDRRGYPYHYLVVLLALLALMFFIDRRIVERHTLLLLPLAAFLAVDALQRLGGRPATLAGFLVLLSMAIHHVATMPNYRVNFNPSKEFMQMTATIAQNTPPHARIVTQWFSEVRYYTGRELLWPVPTSDDPPVELFTEQSSDLWYQRLQARKVDYLLIDDRYIADRTEFRFSRATLANLDALTRQGRARLAASAGALRLFQIVPASGSPSP